MQIVIQLLYSVTNYRIARAPVTIREFRHSVSAVTHCGYTNHWLAASEFVILRKNAL